MAFTAPACYFFKFWHFIEFCITNFNIYLRNKETQQSIQLIVRIPCNVNR